MKKTILLLTLLLWAFALVSCGISVDANPGLHPNLYEIEGDALRLDEENETRFRSALDQIIADTDLQIANMDDEQIIKAARYMGYFGHFGTAIKIYEEALQIPENQWALVMQHNLGRAYENAKLWEYAAARYEYLISVGNTDYQKDLDKVRAQMEKENG